MRVMRGSTVLLSLLALCWADLDGHGGLDTDAALLANLRRLQANGLGYLDWPVYYSQGVHLAPSGPRFLYTNSLIDPAIAPQVVSVTGSPLLAAAHVAPTLATPTATLLGSPAQPSGQVASASTHIHVEAPADSEVKATGDARVDALPLATEAPALLVSSVTAATPVATALPLLASSPAPVSAPAAPLVQYAQYPQSPYAYQFPQYGQYFQLPAEVATTAAPVVTQSVPVPVDKPVSVPVNIGVPTPVNRPVEVPVPVQVDVPVRVEVPVQKPYAVPVDAPFQVPVDKPVEVKVPIPVDVPVPVTVKTPVPIEVASPLAFQQLPGGFPYWQQQYLQSPYLNPYWQLPLASSLSAEPAAVVTTAAPVVESTTAATTAAAVAVPSGYTSGILYEAPTPATDAVPVNTYQVETSTPVATVASYEQPAVAVAPQTLSQPIAYQKPFYQQQPFFFQYPSTPAPQAVSSAVAVATPEPLRLNVPVPTPVDTAVPVPVPQEVGVPYRVEVPVQRPFAVPVDVPVPSPVAVSLPSPVSIPFPLSYQTVTSSPILSPVSIPSPLSYQTVTSSPIVSLDGVTPSLLEPVAPAVVPVSEDLVVRQSNEGLGSQNQRTIISNVQNGRPRITVSQRQSIGKRLSALEAAIADEVTRDLLVPAIAELPPAAVTEAV